MPGHKPQHPQEEAWWVGIRACKRDSPEAATYLGHGALSSWDHFWAPNLLLLLLCLLSPTAGVLREGPLGPVSWVAHTLGGPCRVMGLGQLTQGLLEQGQLQAWS